MPVGQTLEFAKLDDLFLDPVNPRFGRHYAGKDMKQSEVLHLLEMWKLDELGVSFLESGQFWTQDPLICVREKLYGKKCLVVVEGNRRVAALLCLRDAFLGRRKDRLWREIVSRKRAPKDLFTKIPYLLADDRNSVEAFLGFRNVTGIEQWRPSEKAEFIARMVERGMTYEEVGRKIGTRTDTVRRNYICYRLMLQIERIGCIPVENFQDRFSVMYLSLRTGGVQKYLGMDLGASPKKSREPVAGKRIKALANYAVWLFGSESKPPLFTDSRRVDSFGRVLESSKAVNYLETAESPNFEVAVRVSGDDEPETIEHVRKASDHLQIALSRAHHFRKSAVMKATVDRLRLNAKQLLELFPDLS